MARAKVVLTLLFLLTLGAGLVAGMLIASPPATTATAAAALRTPLGAELGLTPEQNAQMHAIWEGVRDKVDACFLRAQDLQKRRDDVLLKLLTPQQQAQYAAAQQDYADALAKLKTERDGLFQGAVTQTEQILNEGQRKRYRQILYTRVGRDAANAPPDWIAPAPTTSPAATGVGGPARPPPQ
jgi:hypothetical protein